MIKLFKILMIIFLMILSVYYVINLLLEVGIEKIKKWIQNTKFYNGTVGFTNKRIMASNIGHYFKYYSTIIHFSLAVINFSIGYFVLTMYPFEYRVLLSSILFLLPWLMLNIINYKTNALTEKQTGDFIISFQEMYSVENDIFPAFKKLEEGLSYPMLGAVKKMNAKYEIGLPAEACFASFKEHFSNELMQTFIEQLSISYKTGGSIDSICENFLKEITRKEENADQDRLNEIIDRYGIYVILVFNVIMMHFGLQRETFLEFVTDTVIGRITLLSNYILTVWIFFNMIKNQ